MKKIYLLLIFLVSCSLYGQQTVLMPNASGTATVTTCNATFYDAGGNGGSHGLNQNSHPLQLELPLKSFLIPLSLHLERL